VTRISTERYNNNLYIPKPSQILLVKHMAKISVNKETCIACGVCWALVPDVFELDPNTGKTRIRPPYVVNDDEKTSEGNIPNELIDAVKNAASSCPTGSIIVE